MRIALVGYGLIWACTGFLNYLHTYVAPYMEIKALAVIPVLTWLLPQLGSGAGLIDEVLQTGVVAYASFMPSLAQAVVLLVIMLIWERRTSGSHAEHGPTA